MTGHSYGSRSSGNRRSTRQVGSYGTVWLPVCMAASPPGRLRAGHPTDHEPAPTGRRRGRRRPRPWRTGPQASSPKESPAQAGPLDEGRTATVSDPPRRHRVEVAARPDTGDRARHQQAGVVLVVRASREADLGNPAPPAVGGQGPCSRFGTAGARFGDTVAAPPPAAAAASGLRWHGRRRAARRARERAAARRLAAGVPGAGPCRGAAGGAGTGTPAAGERPEVRSGRRLGGGGGADAARRGPHVGVVPATAVSRSNTYCPGPSPAPCATRHCCCRASRRSPAPRRWCWPARPVSCTPSRWRR